MVVKKKDLLLRFHSNLKLTKFEWFNPLPLKIILAYCYFTWIFDLPCAK